MTAALAGFGLAGLPMAALAAAICTVNPWFVDDPLSAWLWMCALPGVAGAILLRDKHVPRLLMVVSLLPLLAMLGLSRLPPTGPIPELRLLTMGIDGASWTTVDRLGLPTLGRLRGRGAFGPMHAHEPLFSPVMWTTLFTGRTQAEHGIRGFQVHATDLLVPTVFDIAEHEGHRLGLMGWLVGWPPREQPRGGFLVPGWLAPSPETVPADLRFLKEIELSNRLHRMNRSAPPLPVLGAEGLRHGFRFSTLRDAIWSLGPGRFGEPEVDRQLLRARMQRDVFVAEMWQTRPSVGLYVYYPTDALGHRYWDRQGPADPVARAYRDADSILAEILTLLPEDGRAVVVSDHGFRAIDRAGEGSLVSPRTAPIEALVQGITHGEPLVGRVGAKVVVSVRSDVAPVETALSMLVLDGRPLFRVTEAADDSRTLVLDLTANHVRDDQWDAAVGGRPLRDWLEPNAAYTGDHDPEGMFLALGPGVRPQQVDVDALDVAPILLSLLGLHRGALPGTVPPGVPDVGPGPSWDFVRQTLVFPPSATEGVNQEMLEALGYVDNPPP
jgi:hypothetical protein